MGIFKEYMLQSSLHGAKYVVDSDKYSRYERVFWAICIILSWVGSVFLIKASLNAFNNNAISFVVESSYLNWDTEFPAVFICENKNMDRVQKAADQIFGEDHDFSEVLLVSYCLAIIYKLLNLSPRGNSKRDRLLSR